MLFENAKELPEQSLSPDVLIVGAGAVGLCLGVALARKNCRVAILEAGPEYPDTDFRRRNGGRSIGRKFNGLRDGRMKALGGTTRLWGGQLTPFTLSDFQRVEAGRRLWPMEYSDIVPYFERAAGFLGVTVAGHHEYAAWEKEIGALRLGAGLAVSHHFWLKTPDFAEFFAKDLRDLPNLSVILNQEVERLSFDESGRVTVHAALGDGYSRTYTAEQTVLANGTLEIARRLLQAATTEENCPFHTNQWIGRGFIDHLHGVAGRLSATDMRRLRNLFDVRFGKNNKYNMKLRVSDERLSGEGAVNCAASFTSTGTIREYIAESKILAARVLQSPTIFGAAGAARRSFSTAQVILPLIWSYLVKRRAYNLFGNEILIGLEVEQAPTTESRLLLDPEGDPRYAEIAVDWRLDGREIKTVTAFMRDVAAFVAREQLGEVVLEPGVRDGDPAFLESCHEAFHHMGGGRMSATASTGVVDSNLKVHGSPNLYLLGAAVFPTGSFANPTFTAMAFAHRLADHLRSSASASSWARAKR